MPEDCLHEYSESILSVVWWKFAVAPKRDYDQIVQNDWEHWQKSVQINKISMEYRLQQTLIKKVINESKASNPHWSSDNNGKGKWKIKVNSMQWKRVPFSPRVFSWGVCEVWGIWINQLPTNEKIWNECKTGVSVMNNVKKWTEMC